MNLVLLNPRAGGGRAQRHADRIGQRLRDHHPGVRLAVIDGVAPASQLIADQPRGTRIALVGGDGTVHRMLPALLAAGCGLGLVPMGSGNDTARALGVATLPWAVALDHALTGALSAIDIGECEMRLVSASGAHPPAEARCLPFISSLAAGFDAGVCLRALRGPAWLSGLPRYLWATLGEVLALRRWPITVTLDGDTLAAADTLFASVLNTPTYGAGLPALPHARPDDGRLDLVRAGAFGRPATLAMLPCLLAGRHLSHPQVLTRPFTVMSARSDIAVPLAGDGEPLGLATDWRITVRPGALAAVRHAPAHSTPAG